MRLIDADALMHVIDQKFQKHYGNSVYQFIHDFFTCVLRQTRKAPTVDAVPVVRCRDCKHFRENTDRHGGVHMNCIKSNHIPKVEAEHFCSYGERKGGDG